MLLSITNLECYAVAHKSYYVENEKESRPRERAASFALSERIRLRATPTERATSQDHHLRQDSCRGNRQSSARPRDADGPAVDLV